MALIRKKTGNFLEDFRLGQVFRHKGGRTVTEGLTAHFTDFSFTANPLHKNLRYARAYGYPSLPIPPGLVMAVAFSQTVEDISENARANLEYIDMRFGSAVYAGDTIETETTVLGVKSSASRPELGVVHVQSVARKQSGEIVLAYQRKVQVFRHDPGAALDEGEVAAAHVDVELELPAYDPNARLFGARAPVQRGHVLRGFRSRRHDRALARTRDDRRAHLPDGNARQHFAGALQPDHDRPRPEPVPRREAGRLRRDSVRALPRAVQPRHLGQQPRRRGLPDRPPHRADLLGRHGLRVDRDRRQARPRRVAPISAGST